MTQHVIPPKTGQSFIVKSGQTFRVEDLDGEQVGDFVCFSEHDHKEHYSQAKTRVRNWTVRISIGAEIISNRDNVMFTVIEDTVGVHDITFCECHSWVYEHMFKTGPRNGCQENLAIALADYGIELDQIPDPFNIFMNTSITDNHELFVGAPLSKAGDHLTLRAEMDCLVGLTACADDVTQCNGGNCTRIGVEIN